MTSITTHVLDTALGNPASGLHVALFELKPGSDTRIELKRGVTNADGRVGDLYAGLMRDDAVYCLEFDTGEYFAASGTEGFYPKVAVYFQVASTERHYHVPLLLSPYGYSTYRGS